MKVYIGYDDREQVAYDVCRHSILKRASIPVQIVPLMHRALRNSGLFRRPWKIEATGQYICEVDGRPFSTQFSHSRFLVPQLAKECGDEWALFVDCDFIFLDDIARLYTLRDENVALQCVQRNYKSDGIKMDGMVQQSYSRKLWSSLMLFNVNHEGNSRLTHEEVNTWDGRKLHNFGWLYENEIGAVPEAWNWIPGHSSGKPSAVHYTEGMPFMAGYENEAYSDVWMRELVSIHHPSMRT